MFQIERDESQLQSRIHIGKSFLIKETSILGFSALAVTLLMIYLSPNFFSIFNLTTLGDTLSIYVLAALGPTFVILAGSLDISYMGIVQVAGLVVALTMDSLGIAALGLGLLVGLTAGLINGIATTRLRVPSFLTTLATLFVLIGIANYLTGGYPISVGKSLNFLMAGNPSEGIIFWGIALTLISYLLSRYSHFGLNVYAVGSNASASKLMGLSPNRVRVLAFVVSGLLAAISGILVLPYVGSAGSYSLTSTNLIFIPLAAILMGGTSLGGGKGNHLRTFYGCYIIAIILNGLALLTVNSNISTILVGLAIILATAVASRKQIKIT